MNPQKNNATLLLELGDRVRRSWWTVVAGICLGLSGGAIALQHMPKVYEATTRVWISKQEISEGVVESTVRDDTALKLAAFRDSVLADQYILKLIEQTFGMPSNDEELTARMNQIRGNVSIQTVQSRGRGVQAFALAYRDNDARRAANVVNTLANLYVTSNSDSRMESAVKIAGAIQEMVEEAKKEFDAADQKLAVFKKRHQFETAEHLATNVQMLESRKRDVESLKIRRDLLQRDLVLAEEELSQARIQAETLPSSVSGNLAIDPLTRKIATTKRELEELRVRYTEGHPDVRRKRRALDDLLAEARERNEDTEPVGTENSPGLSRNPVIATIQKRIQTIESQLVRMNSDEVRLQGEISDYERRIRAEPEVQRKLTELEGEHFVVREKLRKLERQAEGAEGSINLEETSMAEGMEIIRVAVVPDKAIEPNPMTIYVSFLVAGLILFVGPMLARYALNPPITSELGLRALTSAPLLVTVPRIMTAANRGLPRRNLFKNVAFSILACAVLLASLKFYV